MSKESVKKFLRSQKRVLAVIVLIVVLSLFGEIFVGNFISVKQAFLTVKFATFVALFGLCQMVVVSSGRNAIDLSVGYVATFSAILGCHFMQGSNRGLLFSILLAVLAGAGLGLVNGLLISYVNLSPLVVTMSVSTIIQGIINVYASGMSLDGSPAPVLTTLVTGTIKGTFPNIIFLLLFVMVIVHFLTKRVKFGQLVCGIGENSEAAYLSGVNVKLTRCITFVISGIIAGLIGLILAGNMGMAYKDMGSTYVMPSYAAIVVGGISLGGGEMDYVRVVLGAIFLQVLTNLFILFGGGDAVKWFGYGAVLYVLLLFYANERKRN
ncbi:MAG: ABC transporter permease [Hespellia sp.]|jgi:ribose transport system permease protein|nr:ABC transporter permease [Hespellia sp.]